MDVMYGEGKTQYGPGVSIYMNGDEVATAIVAWLESHGIVISGPRTVKVNGELCEMGHIYVDPSGSVDDNGQELSGRGA